MTTSTFALNVLMTTDAQFRVWGKAISDALTAVGIPKSGDTGQIDWTSVTKPVSTNVSAGYEIRYLNDSLHGTAPVYIKIEYGTGSGATTVGSLWITTGNTTNGSGTLSGFTSPRTSISFNVTTSEQLVPISASLSGFALPIYSTAGYAFVSVERIRNSSGAITSFGHTVLIKPSTALTYFNQCTVSAATSGTYFSGASTALPRPMGTGGTASVSMKIPYGPLYAFTNTGGLGYTDRCVSVPSASASIGSVLYFERFGLMKPFLITPVTYFSIKNNGLTNSDSGASVAILWE